MMAEPACSTSVHPQVLARLGQRRGKLREELSRKILQLVEFGEMHSLKEKWWDARRRCLSDGDDEMATTIKREGRCKEMAFILGMKQMGKQLLINY